jgi:hypothetical protein
MNKYFAVKIYHFLRPNPSDLLLDGLLVGLTDSALVDKSGVFPSRHHPPWFSILTYHPGDEK